MSDTVATLSKRLKSVEEQLSQLKAGLTLAIGELTPIPEGQAPTFVTHEDVTDNDVGETSATESEINPSIPNTDSTTTTNTTVGIATIEQMQADFSLIPDPWNRPYPDTKPKRTAAKIKAHMDALDDEDEKAIAETGVIYADFMLNKAKRNLKRVDNIETENTKEADDKTFAYQIAEVDVARWEFEKTRFENANNGEPAQTQPPVESTSQPSPPPPPPQPVEPQHDVRDLPEGYAFVEGTPSNETYSAYTNADWTIDLMLEHGKIYQTDRPVNPVSDQVNIPKDVTELNALITTLVGTDADGNQRNMPAVMNEIMKHGASVEAIPVTAYPALVQALYAIPVTSVSA